MSKNKQLVQLSEAEKALNTRTTMRDDMDKVRQTLKDIQNLLGSQSAKIARYANTTGRSMPEIDLDNFDLNLNRKIVDFRDATAGIIEQYRTRKFLPGVRSHGVQMAAFQPKYLEAGTEEAKAHKGGHANAQ